MVQVGRQWRAVDVRRDQPQHAAHQDEQVPGRPPGDTEADPAGVQRQQHLLQVDLERADPPLDEETGVAEPQMGVNLG